MTRTLHHLCKRTLHAPPPPSPAQAIFDAQLHRVLQRHPGDLGRRGLELFVEVFRLNKQFFWVGEKKDPLVRRELYLIII